MVEVGECGCGDVDAEQVGIKSGIRQLRRADRFDTVLEHLEAVGDWSTEVNTPTCGAG